MEANTFVQKLRTCTEEFKNVGTILVHPPPQGPLSLLQDLYVAFHEAFDQHPTWIMCVVGTHGYAWPPAVCPLKNLAEFYLRPVSLLTRNCIRVLRVATMTDRV